MTRTQKSIDTVVIGGGQAGLATGYFLSRQGRSFVILDANERVGDAWRKRWASLCLFTPAFYNGLPGLRFPGSRRSFPTKDEMAAYLEEYAERFALPVRNGVTVEKLAKENGSFIVSANGSRIEADNVVVSTGFYRIPKVPAFAADLDPRIVQLHSSEYVDPSQLQDGNALVVGVGNSGAEIAYELAETRECILAGRNAGQIPVRHGSLPSWPFFVLFRFVQHHVIRIDTRIGRKVAAKRAGKAEPLIRRREKDLVAAGIERAPRVVGVQDGHPLLEDGRVLDVANVVWCTGFRPDFGWIDLPIFDEQGKPQHHRGVVDSVPGLYFVGLKFQYSASSDVLPSRGRDAEYVVKKIAARESAPAGAPEHVLAAA